MISLTPNAEERSSYIVRVSLFDENGDAVLPGAVTEISWSLRDSEGTVINNRLDVPVTPAPSFSIVLTGDDLEMLDPSVYVRSLSVVCAYNSDTYGELALAEELVFSLNTVASGGVIIAPSDSILCTVYDWCFDEQGSAPLPTVTAVAYLINNPVHHAGKMLKETIFSPTYNPENGYLFWKIPQGTSARLKVKETGLDAEVDIPNAPAVHVKDLL